VSGSLQFLSLAKAALIFSETLSLGCVSLKIINPDIGLLEVMAESLAVEQGGRMQLCLDGAHFRAELPSPWNGCARLYETRAMRDARAPAFLHHTSGAGPDAVKFKSLMGNEYGRPESA
jgi:hypothetical protein